MAARRGLEEFRSTYGCSREEEEEGDVSDEEEWLGCRPLSSRLCSSLGSLPPSKKRRLDAPMSKANQPNLSLGNKPSIQEDPCLGHSRTIIHVDIDCFYAQVEMIRNPNLRNLPLGIQQKHIVVTCNYVARKFGVKKLSYISDAKKTCPDLVLVNGEDLTVYREFSWKVHSLLTREFTPQVERLGMDENFLDVTDLVALRLQNSPPEDRNFSGFIYSGNSDANKAKKPCPCGCHERLKIGSSIAAEVRQAILCETGLTCCAGVSYNKLLAKLVGGWKKPNMQTTLLPEGAEGFLSCLEARDIPGIGHTMAKKLRTINVLSVTDLLSCPNQVLEQEFGKLQAMLMSKLCRGIDNSKVIPSGVYKSITDEDSFKKCSSLENARKRISNLVEGLLPRISSSGYVPDTVKVTVRRQVDHSYKRESRQCRLPHPVSFANKEKAKEELLSTCLHLFSKVIDVRQPFHLTLLGITLSNFQKSSAVQSQDISRFFRKSTSQHQGSTSSVNGTLTNDYKNNPTASVSNRVKAISCKSLKDADCKSKSDSLDSEDHKLLHCSGLSAQECQENGIPAGVDCPKGIDPTVFAELPSEVQRELQQHWKQQKTQTILNANKETPKAKKCSGIQRYFVKT